CDGTSTFGNSESTTNDWVKIYQGDLVSSPPTATQLVGDKASDDQSAKSWQISGDRALAGNNGTEYLCFRFYFRAVEDALAPADLDATTGVGPGEGDSNAENFNDNDSNSTEDNEFQGKSVKVTFVFYAEQSSAPQNR
ncbi:MAG: hypothetical protein HY329_16220, partial [Chloroflexi bacterium]|nr:hypothetical protein [Chloroflexota bacterium]